MRFDSTAGRNWKSLLTAPNVLYRAPHIAPTTPWGGFGSAAADAMFAFGLRIGFDSTSARRDIVSGIGSRHWSVLQIVLSVFDHVVITAECEWPKILNYLVTKWKTNDYI